MTSALERALVAYDGRHADVLKEIAAQFEPKAAVLREAVRLSGNEDRVLAKGASYLLWAWLTDGAAATPRTVKDLAARLPALDDKWVLLHVVRCVPLIRVDAGEAAAFATFLRRCSKREFPFLRAWSVDSLHRLALDHPRHAPKARQAMEAALDDPAPSVRKIVKRILET